jgi:hypothetical protein
VWLAHNRGVARDVYRFHSEWALPVGRRRAFDVLADLGSYPVWWPQVRSVRQVADDRAELLCRSLLPYDLQFEAARTAQDEHEGLLAVDLTGDLEGYARWRVTGTTDTSRMSYDQEVVLRKPLPRLVSSLLRPVLRANHEWMMRNGERGLLGYVTD